MFINVLLVIISILLFSLVIFIHELGHFMTAKLCGVKVNEFAIGMGPAIFKFKKKDTLYALRLFPIGGYCAMEGEDTESNSKDAFSQKSVFKRIIIVASGAIMNIILAFIFMVLVTAQQTQFASTKISKFSENAITNQYGLKAGDIIKSIDGYNISTFTDINFMLAINKNFTADIIVDRDGEEIKLDGVKFRTREDNGKTVLVRDFYVFPIEKNIGTVMTQSFKEMGSNIRITYATLIGMVTGKLSINEVSGPVGLVSVISTAASEGLKVNFLAALNNVIMVMMLLSVNLGIFNLLPIPALDGGRLVFLIIEAIKGSPINPKYEGLIHTVGFALLFLLILLVTVNDIIKLFSVKGMAGL